MRWDRRLQAAKTEDSLRYGGQVAFAGNSLYHATKWGIEGFVESVAQKVASFGIGMNIVEPGGARTEFATVARGWQSSCPSTTKPPPIASWGCSIPWLRTSSRASMWSLRRCGWCSVHRHWRPPLQPCASESQASKRRLNSPLRRTSHRGITLATLRREYFANGANRENCP
jgi:hypothetical protein